MKKRITGEEILTIERFTEIAEEELALLPDYVHEELNGGVIIDPKVYPHPARMAEDLYILGIYTSNTVMGKQIVLFYGSFLVTMQYAAEERYRRQIRDTLRHEFLHHLETRAGLFGKGTLIEEDENRMRRYYLAHKPPREDETADEKQTEA